MQTTTDTTHTFDVTFDGRTTPAKGRAAAFKAIRAIFPAQPNDSISAALDNASATGTAELSGCRIATA